MASEQPNQKTEKRKCRWCGQTMIVARQGKGRMFNGRLLYWYTEPNPHYCPEREAIRKGIVRL